MASLESTFLPEEQVPQDLTGCQVEINRWIGTVVGTRDFDGGPGWEIDYGRGFTGIRPDPVVRKRVLAITEELEN
ncbi:hypothetical protein HOG17_03730 [Candidatus Peregrinibacteria bacterium]|mgnify:FL=1|jgi:hypothetical protein|nr:hypothetical protein [Candidatus Peregrinibacteria bacterium]MBT4148313.1 hypothetical protein [Candidatus Peregrinibacteria bacterium]MBT4366406.1 hypothetical protein [Candidatus Peregrinibacteria bacterium]MBT4455934.1 hypothetical protein [Candidatus Peregrinibacteria bacterium]